VFRTSVPGHYDCQLEEAHSPINFIPYLDPKTDKYNWRKPVVADHQWLRVLGRQQLFNFQYLNVSHSNFRPDAHAEFKRRRGSISADCLHWCSPGVPGKLSLI
jgi:hypothetical protein